MDYVKLVREFHDKFDANPMYKIYELRYNLLKEELDELMNAQDEREELDALLDIAYIAAGTIDILDEYQIDFEINFEEEEDPFAIIAENVMSMEGVVDRKPIVEGCQKVLCLAIKTMGYLGYNVEDAFKEVHDSNMSKLGIDGLPVKRADGKILKGPNYRAPDLTPFLLLSEK